LTRTEGVVLKGTGGVWHVRADSGETYEASLRGRLKQEREEAKKLAVGDRVVLETDQRGVHWAIAEILPRHSQLARREPGAGQGERIVAANVDQVVVVFAAAKPEPHRRMLDRFLVIAEGNSLESRVVINKIELVDRNEVERAFSDYAAAGYPVHFTSVKQRVGLDELHDVGEQRSELLVALEGGYLNSALFTPARARDAHRDARRLLARAAGIPARSAELVRGASARDKVVRLPGVAAADTAERLAARLR